MVPEETKTPGDGDPHLLSKQRLFNEIDEATAAAADYERLAQEQARHLRKIQDEAKATRDVIETAPVEYVGAVDLTPQIETYRMLTRSLRSATEHQRAEFTRVTYSAMGTTNTTAAALSFIDIPGGLRAQVVGESPHYVSARARFFQLQQIPELRSEIEKSLLNLGLDVPYPGHRTVADLLDEAIGALDRPVVDDGRGISTLVSLRSAIDATFASFMGRRPGQARPKKWPDKVQALGRQYGRDDLTPAQLDALAKSAAPLESRLSEGKSRDLSRATIREIMQQGLIFLNTLLRSIDENRLRPG
jgi:hypothetical protein